MSGQNMGSGVSAQRHVVGEDRSGEDDGGFDVIVPILDRKSVV